MSKSPRRLLHRAADTLRELDEIRAKHPDVNAELEAAMGAARLAEFDAAARVVRAAAEAMPPS